MAGLGDECWFPPKVGIPPLRQISIHSKSNVSHLPAVESVLFLLLLGMGFCTNDRRQTETKSAVVVVSCRLERLPRKT